MICPICGIEFEGRRNKKYCVAKCKRKAKRRKKAEKRWEFFVKENPQFASLKSFEEIGL